MAELLDRIWRTAATGFSIAFIFVGGMMLAALVLPAFALAKPGPKAARRLIHRIFRFYIRMIQAFGLIEVEVDGLERARAHGRGRLIVANHPSLLDVVILMSLIPELQCIVKAELWSSRTLGRLVRAAGFIRNDLEPEALLAACRESLDAGVDLLVFPEGTRSEPGCLPVFKRGFANIATLAGAAIQLVVISCEPVMLTKSHPWWRIPERKSHFRITFAGRLEPADIAETASRAIDARRLVRRLETFYANELAHG